MYGLVDIQRNLKDGGMQGFKHNAELEKQRNMTNQQLDAQHKQGMMTTVGTAAGIGTAIMPGIGTAVGAGVGLLAYSLF